MIEQISPVPQRIEEDMFMTVSDSFNRYVKIGTEAVEKSTIQKVQMGKIGKAQRNRQIIRYQPKSTLVLGYS